MPNDCTIRPFQECSCTQTECKSHAVHLGRFTKPRPAPYDTTPIQYALVGMAALLAVLFVAPEAFERVRAITQEEVQ
jgi:hypothetical protein